MSGGFETTDLDTTYNLGGYNNQGITVAPYGVVKFLDYLSFDATVGHTWGDIESSRRPTTGTSQGVNVTGSTDSRRLFGAGNFNANYPVKVPGGQLNLGATVGYLYAHEKIDGYTESNGNAVGSATVNLGQIRGGGRIGYRILDMVEPYVGASYQYDHVNSDISVGTGEEQPKNDDSGYTLNVGVNLFMLDNRLTGAIEAKTEEGREQFDNYSVSANIRFEF